MQSASVEWFEQGETKGKEVGLYLIEMLNPDIIIERPPDMNEQPELRHTEELRIPNVSFASSFVI